jgi:type II secretory pathway pseudopilin PulG
MKAQALILSFTVVAAACGSSSGGGIATERYYQAMEKKLAGDPRGYYEDLIDLAREEPDTRAGRRARAAIGGGIDPITGAAILGVLSAVAIPNFLKFQQRAKNAGLKSELMSLYVEMQMYQAENNRYCRNFSECSSWAPSSEYLFLLGDDMKHPPSMGDAELLKVQALALLESMGISPVVTNDGFVVVAVGNLDSDADLDVWTLDHNGEVFNVLSD